MAFKMNFGSKTPTESGFNQKCADKAHKMYHTSPLKQTDKAKSFSTFDESKSKSGNGSYEKIEITGSGTSDNNLVNTPEQRAARESSSNPWVDLAEKIFEPNTPAAEARFDKRMEKRGAKQTEKLIKSGQSRERAEKKVADWKTKKKDERFGKLEPQSPAPKQKPTAESAGETIKKFKNRGT